MRIPSGTTDRYIYFVAVDSTDLKTRKTALSSFTVYYEIENGTATAMTTPTITESDATNMPGVYTLLIDESGMTTLTAGHDTAELCVHITQASMAPVTRTVEIYRVKFTEGQTATVANNAVDADIERLQGTAIATPTVGGVLEVDITHVSGSAVSTSSAQLGVNVVNAGGTAWGSGAITAASIATGAVDADAIATDAATEIANAVWDTDATAHQTQGTFGQAIGDPAADTGTIYKAVVTDATGATVGVDVVDLKTQIGTAGAGLTAIDLPDQTMNITGNITGNLSGSVGSVTGLTASNLDATVSSRATPAQILTTALTESYAADGAAPTLAQAVFAIQQFLQEKSISSTTMTVNKLDGTTAAMTFTLDSATAPTSITRAS